MAIETSTKSGIGDLLNRRMDIAAQIDLPGRGESACLRATNLATNFGRFEGH